MQKTCVILAGPTAVGKTALAIEVAKHYHTEIISADSRQCYKELNIGVAKPNAEELNTVPHHFIHCLSIQDDFTAADYEAYALQTIGNIFQKNNFAVVCGGTGLYIRAFVEGLDDIPAIAPNIRQAIEEEYGEKGITWLKDTLQQSDPIYALQGEMFNPNRMMRALEVFRGTGTSIVKFQTGQKKKRDFKIIQICLEMPRARLYEKINARVDSMMDAGLEAEARGLKAYRALPALQTVGYKELFQYFDGSIDLGQAVDLIKQNTRRYAKRQITWFRKVEGMKFCPAEKMELLRLLDQV